METVLVSRSNKELWAEVKGLLLEELKRLDRRYSYGRDLVGFYYNKALEIIKDNQFAFCGGELVNVRNGVRFSPIEVILVASITSVTGFASCRVWDCVYGSYNGDWEDQDRLVAHFVGISDEEIAQHKLEDEIFEFEEYMKWGI